MGAFRRDMLSELGDEVEGGKDLEIALRLQLRALRGSGRLRRPRRPPAIPGLRLRLVPCRSVGLCASGNARQCCFSDRYSTVPSSVTLMIRLMLKGQRTMYCTRRSIPLRSPAFRCTDWSNPKPVCSQERNRRPWMAGGREERSAASTTARRARSRRRSAFRRPPPR